MRIVELSEHGWHGSLNERLHDLCYEYGATQFLILNKSEETLMVTALLGTAREFEILKPYLKGV